MIPLIAGAVIFEYPCEILNYNPSSVIPVGLAFVR